MSAGSVEDDPVGIWHRGQWSDFSNVGFPSGKDELMTCTVCHQKAPQAANFATVANPVYEATTKYLGWDVHHHH